MCLHVCVYVSIYMSFLLRTHNRPGYIKEEAAARCGGEQHLKEAVARGAVRTASSKGGELLFYFPEMTIGSEESVTHRQTMCRERETRADAFKETEDAMLGTTWQIGSGTRALEAMVTCFFVRMRGDFGKKETGAFIQVQCCIKFTFMPAHSSRHIHIHASAFIQVQ